MTSTNPPPPSYEAPPTYDNFKKDVANLVEKAKHDPDIKKKIQQNVFVAAADKETLKKIQDGVNDFVANVSRINAAFDSVLDKVVEIDLQKKPMDDKGTVYEGETEWTDIRKKWREMLTSSQETARKSVSRLSKFQQLCEGAMELKDFGSQACKDTITELQNFVKQKSPDGKYFNLEETEKQATTHSNAFLTLKDKVTKFKAKFDVFIDYQKAKIDPQITKLQGDITKIEGDMAFDSKMVLDLGVTLGVTAFGTLAGGVLLAAFPPFAIGALIIGGIITAGVAGSFIYYVTQYYLDKAKRDGYQSQINDLEAQKSALEAIRSKLESQETGMGLIVSQVDRLASVWGAVSNEADYLSTQLNGLNNNSTLSYLQKDIRGANEIYKTLALSLNKFALVK